MGFFVLFKLACQCDLVHVVLFQMLSLKLNGEHKTAKIQPFNVLLLAPSCWVGSGNGRQWIAIGAEQVGKVVCPCDIPMLDQTMLTQKQFTVGFDSSFLACLIAAVAFQTHIDRLNQILACAEWHSSHADLIMSLLLQMPHIPTVA